MKKNISTDQATDILIALIKCGKVKLPSFILDSNIQNQLSKYAETLDRDKISPSICSHYAKEDAKYLLYLLDLLVKDVEISEINELGNLYSGLVNLA